MSFSEAKIYLENNLKENTSTPESQKLWGFVQCKPEYKEAIENFKNTDANPQDATTWYYEL